MWPHLSVYFLINMRYVKKLKLVLVGTLLKKDVITDCNHNVWVNTLYFISFCLIDIVIEIFYCFCISVSLYPCISVFITIAASFPIRALPWVPVLRVTTELPSRNYKSRNKPCFVHMVRVSIWRRLLKRILYENENEWLQKHLLPFTNLEKGAVHVFSVSARWWQWGQ